MAKELDAGAQLRAALDAVADASLASAGLSVTKRSVGSSTRYLIVALPLGLPVMVAHEHEAHVWLEAGDGWVTHDLAGDATELFDLWKDLLSLAIRIASGAEAPTNLTARGAWATSDGNELYRPKGSGGRGRRGLVAAWTGWVAGRNSRQ